MPKTVSSSVSIAEIVLELNIRPGSGNDRLPVISSLGMPEDDVARLSACRGGDFPAKVGIGLVDAI